MAKATKPDQLEVRYVPLSTLEVWDRNPKLHDLPKLATSITRYGFKDPPKWEPALNDGRGGIVEGNGRSAVLRQMKDDGQAPPRGVLDDPKGDWLVPVLFGVDARSQAEASAYGVDHNSLTLAGGSLGFEDLLQIWDEEALTTLLRDAPDTTDLLVAFDRPALDALLDGPDFSPVAESEQSRLDRKKTVTCPSCGEEFRP